MSKNEPQVDPSLRGAWPPGTFKRQPPGGQQQTPRTLVHDAPATPGGKRPPARTVKPPRKRKTKGK